LAHRTTPSTGQNCSRLPRTAWMQGLARREEELYQMNDVTAIIARNDRMRTNRIPETATFPLEQEQLYGYDAEIELRKSVRPN
jgi:salicylate hydroxylase